MLDRILLILVVLVPSVVLHEVSHGAVALVFGDDTAKRAGRLTLNPIRHIDLFGTVILPIILTFTAGLAFGYAKPVPVDRARLRRPRDHGVLVSLAGPGVNVVLAVLAAIALRAYVGRAEATGAVPGDALAVQVLVAFGVINVILAAFNLIPLPPLDGSAVVERLLPRRWLQAWAQLRRYSMGVVLLVVLLLPGALDRVFGAAIDLWSALL
ncbi:MAG TPA: site-2 protease family protein [Nitriliruptorales bacterium]|nr:site-2 protease family protein [Nitriliruptorales bacterium]